MDNYSHPSTNRNINDVALQYFVNVYHSITNIVASVGNTPHLWTLPAGRNHT